MGGLIATEIKKKKTFLPLDTLLLILPCLPLKKLVGLRSSPPEKWGGDAPRVGELLWPPVRLFAETSLSHCRGNISLSLLLGNEVVTISCAWRVRRHIGGNCRQRALGRPQYNCRQRALGRPQYNCRERALGQTSASVSLNAANCVCHCA